MAIRVILADDHPIIRNSIKSLLHKTLDIQVIAEAADGDETIRLVQDLLPDVLLLDMSLPLKDGVEVTNELKAAGSNVHILAFSGYADPEYIREILNSGASGYLIKSEPFDVVIDAIRGVASGQEGWLSNEVKAIVLGKGDKDSIIINTLTPRERQVCAHVVEGKTNKNIAFELGISEKTVEKYIYSIFQKFDVVSRVELAVRLVQKEGKINEHGT
jgi:two-component system, NarL family, response regulator NreC